MPIYRKGPEAWRVVVVIAGERRDWVVRGTKQDAENWEARQRLSLQATGHEPRSVPTFSSFTGTEYVRHASVRLKESTLRNRGYQLATLDQHFGKLRLDEIRQAHVEAYQNARLAQKIRPATINDEVKVLKAILSHARARYPLPVLRVAKLKVPKKRNVRAWSEEQIQRLLTSAVEHEPEIVPLIVFLANTGCRRGEAIALRWEAVDLKRRVVRIWPSEEWQPKDNEPREVPVSDALLPWLNVPRKGEHVFLGRLGRPFAFWPQHQWDKARAAAGLTGGPHTLRHSYATHFLRHCPDLFLLSRVLGHSHARVTELYAHLLPDQLERARLAVSIPAPRGPGAVQLAARKKRSEIAKANRAKRRA